MYNSDENTHLKDSIAVFFSNPKQHLRLKRGEQLLAQGQPNERLYLIKRGAFKAVIESPEGEKQELFTATQGMFIGVYSFFSRSHESIATVIADQDSEVAFIEQSDVRKVDAQGRALFEQLLPIVVMDLAQRQQREQEMVFERERTLKKLVQTERLASLGQMAAGIAHELNNAIAVLMRNTEWLYHNLRSIVAEEREQELQLYEQGSRSGRLPSREVRQHARELATKYKMPDERAHKIAECGLSADDLQGMRDIEDYVSRMHGFWQMGATIHDMLVAAQHAAHVVRSVRALASGKSEAAAEVDVNQTIREALTLLSSPLRKVDVTLKLENLPPYPASFGELVQVWTNLIRNAIESMVQANIPEPNLTIRSKAQRKHILVTVEDAGHGIPDELQSRIFQPSFTTKEKGLEFGLGLGLTIVERIVTSYGGDIAFTSKPGKTQFKVKFPL